MCHTISFPLYTMDAGHTRLPSTSLDTSTLIKMVAALFMGGYYKQFTTLISVTRIIWKEVLASMPTPWNTNVFRQQIRPSLWLGLTQLISGLILGLPSTGPTLYRPQIACVIASHQLALGPPPPPPPRKTKLFQTHLRNLQRQRSLFCLRLCQYSFRLVLQLSYIVARNRNEKKKETLNFQQFSSKPASRIQAVISLSLNQWLGTEQGHGHTN